MGGENRNEWDTGLLLTLDEIHYRQVDELREITTTIQHAFREEREVAFAAAGLRASVSSLLNDNVLTFLRRSDRYELDAVPAEDVRKALRDPIVEQGGSVADEALQVMVDATQGYPFMIQLIGSHCWMKAAGHIDLEAAKAGVAAAARRLGSLVYEPALHSTSDVDRTFLLAMVQDDGPSKMSDIAERLGVGKKHASVYRQRLLDADLITAPRWGYVDFKLPYLRSYLREHAASLPIR